MTNLIRKLSEKPFITNEELLMMLLDEIGANARESLQLHRGNYVIGEYNRTTIIRMLYYTIQKKERLDPGRILALVKVLQNYLNQYMQNQPEGHKWIILCCVFLTEIVKEPMHPKELVRWKQDSITQRFYCPAYSGAQGSTCLYCVCKPG